MLASMELRGSDIPGSGQNLERQGVAGKILRNKELGAGLEAA